MQARRVTKSLPKFMRSGALLAIAAAVLFGASTPFSKILLGRVDPMLLGGLLYLGSGLGLTLWRMVRMGVQDRCVAAYCRVP